MNASRNIVLIGLRGSGKTTVGAALAQRLGRPFVDCDEIIENKTGLRVTEIFTQRGEAHFRELEHSALVECLGSDGRVVSVGGGAVNREDNRSLLKRGQCVWLDAPSAVLAARLQADARSASLRPALTQLDPLAELEVLRMQRGAYYQQLAALRVETGGKTVNQVVAEIIEGLRPEAEAAGP